MKNFKPPSLLVKTTRVRRIFLKMLVLVGLSLIITDCTDDTDILLNTNESVVPQARVTVEQVFVDDLPSIVNTVLELPYQAKGTHRENDSNVLIDKDRIIKATDSIGNITYAFDILTPTDADNILYNLIVTERIDGNEIPPFVIKYEFENATKYDYAAPEETMKFEARAQIYSYNDFMLAQGLEHKGALQGKSTAHATDPCMEVNNSNKAAGSGGGSMEDTRFSSGGSGFKEPEASVGGAFGTFIVVQFGGIGGGGGGGGGTRGSVSCGELVMLPIEPSNPLQKDLNTEIQAKGTSNTTTCPEGQILLPVNKTPYEIIEKLTGKAKCVYDKMIDEKNNINWILNNFNDGNKPSQYNLRFEMSTTLGNKTNASTVKSGSTFIIKINQSRAENNNTVLTIARTIIHEGIHARLREFASREGSSETSFPGVYDYYRRHGKNWDHQQMASHYRNTIAEGLKQFDNSQHPDAYYDALAWEGLSEIKDLNGTQDKIYTEAWKKLSSTEQQEILKTIRDEKQNGNKTCKKNASPINNNSVFD